MVMDRRKKQWRSYRKIFWGMNGLVGWLCVNVCVANELNEVYLV